MGSYKRSVTWHHAQFPQLQTHFFYYMSCPHVFILAKTYTKHQFFIYMPLSSCIMLREKKDKYTKEERRYNEMHPVSYKSLFYCFPICRLNPVKCHFIFYRQKLQSKKGSTVLTLLGKNWYTSIARKRKSQGPFSCKFNLTHKSQLKSNWLRI